MKRRLFIGFLLGLALLSACTQKAKVPEPVEGPTYELQFIDSLMWRQPDSALARLLPWFDTCCRDAACHVSTASAYNRHYANLLLSELLYKNDYPQNNRKELQQAVGYFDSLTVLADTRGVSLQGRPRRDARRASAQNIAFLDARAHYINGVGYYENDSVVEACKEYMKALEVMEGRFKEKELVGHKAQFMAYTYTRLTELFSNLYLHEQAVYFGKISLVYYDKYDASSRHVAWMLNEIGSHYDMMCNYDSASFYYNEGIILLPDTNNITFRDLATHLAFLSYKKDKSIEIVLRQLHNLINQSQNKKESLSRYAIIGEIYYHEKQYDSAWIYLNIIFHESQSVESKKQVAEWLVEICRTQGREDEILEYAGFLVPFATQDENNSVIKSQLTELYKAFNQSQHERQHEKEMQRHRNRSMEVIAGLSLVTLIVLALYRNNKRRKQHLEKQIKEEKQTHSMEKKALSSRLKKSNETLRELQDQIKKQDRNPLKPETPAATFDDEPICQHILALCNDKKNRIKSSVPITAYANIALNDAQKAQLKNAALNHYGSLFEKMKQQHPELKEKDLQYCYLSLLGLDNVQIAAFLQHSISTIWERENRIKKILGSEERVAVLLHGLMIN